MALEEGYADEGNVIIITSEDDADDTIKPRLEALSANMGRIFTLDGYTKKGSKSQERAFGLSNDLDALENMIEEISGASLVIIDPVNAYLDDVDSHKNADVRNLLTPVSKFAAEHDTSIIMISHPPKTKNAPAVHKFSGSMAFVAAARAAFLIMADPEDRQRRLILPIKHNSGNDKNGLSFKIEKVTTDSGIETSRVVWDSDPVSESADYYLSQDQSIKRPSKTDEAECWLKEHLEEGPQLARDLFY